MDTTASVTVVVPTYNRGDLISETISSILNQSFTNWELIIVDDGSSDNTQEIVEPFTRRDSRIHFIKRNATRTRGANTCRNIGFEQSTGTHIKWMDSDDILEKDCLERQLAAMEASNADVCFCQTEYFEKKGDELVRLQRYWSKHMSAEDISGSLIFGSLRWHTMSGLWKKDILPASPFAEGLQNSQEWLFHISICLQRNLRFEFINDPLTLARVHTGSMSNRSNKGHDYYFHSAFARYLAISEIKDKKVGNYSRQVSYLRGKFLRYQFFTLYKGGVINFLRLLKCYPEIFLRE